MKTKTIMILLIGSYLFINQLIAQNILYNGNFEEGLDPSWELLGDANFITFNLNNTDAISGNNCLQIDITKAGSVAWAFQIKKAGWSVEENKKYITSFWAKASENNMTVNYIIGQTASPYAEYASNYGLKITTSWQKYTLVVEAPVTTITDITYALHIIGPGTYWFDDFQVVSASEFISDATVLSTGKIIYLTFYENISDPSGELQTPFFVRNENNEIKKIATVSKGTNDNMVKLDMEDKIYKNEKITVEYKPGTLATNLGIEITPFLIEAINNSNVKTPVTSIELENSATQVRVFPNPANEIINMQLSNSHSIKNYKIFDVTGKLLMQNQPENNNSFTIDVSELKLGIYFIVSETNEKENIVSKFIKE